MIQPNNDYLTATETKALFESLHHSIRLIAEDQRTMRQDINILKEDVRDIKTRLTTVEDTLRIAIPDLYVRVKALEAARN